MKFKYVRDGNIDNPRTIDEAMGFRKSPVIGGYTSVAELQNALKTMNLVDMQDLAIKLGIKPVGERQRMIRSMCDQFKRLTRTYGNAINAPVNEEKESQDFDPSKF